MKSAKYADLPSSHPFQPIVLETLGSMNSSTVSFFSDLGRFDLAWFSSLSSKHLCVSGLNGAIQILNFFCLHPSLYPLVSWAWWDWPLTWLTNHCPSVLWRCWLGLVTRKTVSEMTYNVSSGMLNSTIPYADSEVSLVIFVNLLTYFSALQSPSNRLTLCSF